MHDGPDRAAPVAASIAAVLGLASAGVSAYWMLGGTALLDTVGGEIERWGRERSSAVVIALGVVVVLKVAGALAPVVLVLAAAGGDDASRRWARRRPVRTIAWAVAIGLTLYGVVLTGAGLLIEAGVLEPSADADRTALRWHTYLWDPWFAAWGAAFVVAMWRSRPERRRGGRRAA